MQDTITKGTGNSRSLRSVPNFLALYPTYEAFAAALVGGTLPIDLGPLNAAGVQQMGTGLNKANLLKDATAALYGMTGSAVPDDVFRATRGLISTAQSTANGRGYVSYGSYVGNGTLTKTLTFPFEPQFLIVVGGGGNGVAIFLKDHAGTSIYANFNTQRANNMDFGSTMGLETTWTANSVTWAGFDAGWAFNSSGTAHYICVG